MEASKLKEILKQHRLWIETNGVQGTRADLSGANLKSAYITGADLRGASLTGANLTDANLRCASLTGANLTGANLTGANLYCAYLNNAIGLPDISWIESGILVQLNNVYDDVYLEKDNKWDSFIQDSIGMFIQNNPEDKTFDMLVGDRIIRNIPDWVKYSGMKKIV
jgi:hypothetical protein